MNSAEVLRYHELTIRETVVPAGKVITVMNMKGGVGTTTVAMHLGRFLARYKLPADAVPRKVLVIDYDPQFNLSQAFLPAKVYFELESKRKTTIAIRVDDDANLNSYQLQVPGNETPPPVATLATRVFTTQSGDILDIVFPLPLT